MTMVVETAAPGAGLVARAEERRLVAAAGLDAKRRAEWGQFFTPGVVAEFLASFVSLPLEGTVRVVDPGAGTGSLSAALVARVLRERPGMSVEVVACEIDASLHGPLRETLEDCVRCGQAAGTPVDTTVVGGDFVDWATGGGLFGGDPGACDVVVMNPPYRKLARASRQRRLVRDAGAEVPNLYAAFLVLGVTVLREGGQLVAITPRSFANGSYFSPFRRFLLERTRLDTLHVFASRSTVFADADVLQENVVFAATRVRASEPDSVEISTSTGFDDPPTTRTVPYADVVHPDDPYRFIHISTDKRDDQLRAVLASLPATLGTLEVQVSTGRVVDFRSADHLRPDPGVNTVPLIYPLHLHQGRVRWPVPMARKPNALALNEATANLTFPNGHYVVVKRMSSKEERRRVVAAVFDPEDVPCVAVGFENHVNVLHWSGHGLPAEVARGLCLWLNSTVLDRLVRRFNGHTQINATDLRNLRYPATAHLTAAGQAWTTGPLPSQDEIDRIIDRHVPACGIDR